MAWLWYTVLGLAVFLAQAALVGGYIGFRLSLVRRDEEVKELQEPDPNVAKRTAMREAGKQWLFSHSPEEVELRARDGLTLRGYYIPAAKPSKRMVVFAHGYRCNGPDEFGAFLEFYHDEMNCHILLPDQRGHGRSDGKYIGFAALEWRDILDWADMFVRRIGADTEVVLHGVSMGGATVMNCNANNPPEYVKCVVEDCGYTNGYEMIRLAASRDLNLNIPPLFWGLRFWYRVLLGRSLKKDADPCGRIGDFKCPTLFVHGAVDGFVPTEMGLRCHEAARVPKELLLIEGAGHAMSYFIGKEEYEARLKAFLEQWMGEREGVF